MATKKKPSRFKPATKGYQTTAPRSEVGGRKFHLADDRNVDMGKQRADNLMGITCRRNGEPCVDDSKLKD